MMNPDAAIKDAYRRLYEGMIAKDTALLEEVLTPDFVLVHMTGLRQPKEVFIRAVADDTLNYFSADHAHVTVHTDGERVLFTGQSFVEAAVFGGDRRFWRLQLDGVARCEGGRWRIAFAEASTY